MTARTGAGRYTRAADRKVRRRALVDLLTRLDRLTPAETALLVDYVETELGASDALRSSLVGVERALQQRDEQLLAAEAAIVEIEQDRDRALAAHHHQEGPMANTEHVPDLCPNCGGLTVIRWDRLEGVSGISIDGQPLPAANLWVAEQPGPCKPPTTKEH